MAKNCPKSGKKHMPHCYWDYDDDKNRHRIVYCDGSPDYYED